MDYAHARGIRVVLFASPVYAHDERDRAEWLALPGLLGRQPDWFRSLSPPGGRTGRYLFDYSRPGTRDYLAGVIRKLVDDHGADGVKLDGLGDVEGQIIPFDERATHLSQRWALTPVMDVYRLVAQTLREARPDAYLESGWVNPAPAQALAHTFRYGDEWDVFDREYPFPGLAQHFAYAAVQRSVLGQRPNVGAVFGGFNRPIADQWLGAALALGAQVSLGSDLTFLSPDGLAALRALLVHQRPFAGTTRTGGDDFGLRPSWAATVAGDLTFVALLNDAPADRTIALDLADAGLPLAPGETALAYDVAAAGFARVGARLSAEVPGQTLRLFVLRRTTGVVWTTSGFEEQPLGSAGTPGATDPPARGWRVRVRGPRTVPGRLQLYFPDGPPAAVTLDGRPLTSFDAGAERPAGAEGYTYDASTGHLEVRYTHAGLVPGVEAQPERTVDVLCCSGTRA